ncbi:MAG: hypothetical protein IRZ00_00955 [Gemmatimonadetes bacterium]|nr:hypothetical protein [Gemmatimonadota bacterium]
MGAGTTAAPGPLRMMIVGAPKAATTSLKDYLGQHPGIYTHPQRELEFFAGDRVYRSGFDHVLRVYYRDARPGAVLVGKSVAMMYSAKALERLQQHNPEIQVVVALRNPADRAYSEYWYARRRGWEPMRTFEAAIRDGGERFGGDTARAWRCAYLQRSAYAPYLAAIYERFGRDRVHVILAEDLRTRAVEIVQALYRALPGLDPDFTPRVVLERNAAAAPRWETVLHLTSNATALPRVRRLLRRVVSERARYRLREAVRRANEREFRPPPMRPEIRAELAAHFAPLNRQLSELIGRDVDRVWGEPAARPVGGPPSDGRRAS